MGAAAASAASLASPPPHPPSPSAPPLQRPGKGASHGNPGEAGGGLDADGAGGGGIAGEGGSGTSTPGGSSVTPASSMLGGGAGASPPAAWLSLVSRLEAENRQLRQQV